MRLAQILVLLEKLFLVLFTLGLVVYLWVVFNDWADPFKTYFSRIGDLETYVYLTLLVLIITYVFKKLLLWEVHLLFRPSQKRGRQEPRQRGRG